jgi:hypothetical protein
MLFLFLRNENQQPEAELKKLKTSYTSHLYRIKIYKMEYKARFLADDSRMWGSMLLITSMEME